MKYQTLNKTRKILNIQRSKNKLLIYHQKKNIRFSKKSIIFLIIKKIKKEQLIFSNFKITTMKY